MKGFLKDLQIYKKVFTQYSNDIDYFISFVKQNWLILVKSGFVFQIDPLFYQFKPFVIHIIPLSHGKAVKAIIDKLYEIFLDKNSSRFSSYCQEVEIQIVVKHYSHCV